MTVTVGEALNMLEDGYRLEINDGKISDFIPEDKEC